jgi:hypothetical protein
MATLPHSEIYHCHAWRINQVSTSAAGAIPSFHTAGFLLRVGVHPAIERVGHRRPTLESDGVHLTLSGRNIFPSSGVFGK